MHTNLSEYVLPTVKGFEIILIAFTWFALT